MPRRPPTYCASPSCNRFSVKGSAYCEEHRAERQRAVGQLYDAERGTPAARGYNKAWHRIRGKKLKEQPLCELCRVAKADTVHHIKPLRQGGTHTLENLQSVCRGCHSVLHPEKGRSSARTGSTTRVGQDGAPGPRGGGGTLYSEGGGDQPVLQTNARGSKLAGGAK